MEGVGVKNVATDGKRVVGVDTDHGFVHCEKFINSSGLVRSIPYPTLLSSSCSLFLLKHRGLASFSYI